MSHAQCAYQEATPSTSFQSPTDAADSGQISTILLRALVDVLQQRGISPEQLFGERSEALYTEPAQRTVSRAWFQAQFARAIELTGDPALGLHCGLTASQTSFGLMSALIAHAHDLRHGLALAAQFHPLLIERCGVRVEEQLGVAQLRCELEPLGAGDRSFVELVIAGLMRTLLSFGCAPHEIRAVCFKHARPAYYHAYASAFSGTERFAQPFNGIEFAASALDRPHLHRHAELHELVLAHAEQDLQRCSRPLTLTERVAALMSSRHASKLPDMVSAARELGISVRSLRRHLDQEGTTYRELTQSKLHACACSLLRNPNVSLQSVAFELGFSDATAFHRAFRRWTKLTPAEYRAAYLRTEQSA
jgi:AraC-like DNA-binding protein